jgi:hypothetical protein
VTIRPDTGRNGHVALDSSLVAEHKSLERVEEAAIVLLSGIAAEEYALSEAGEEALSIEEHGAHGDVNNVARLLLANRKLVPETERDALTDRAMASARRFVHGARVAIEGFAEALCQLETFDEQAVAVMRRGLLVHNMQREKAQREKLELVKGILAEREVSATARRTREAVERARKAPTPARRFGRA